MINFYSDRDKPIYVTKNMPGKNTNIKNEIKNETVRAEIVTTVTSCLCDHHKCTGAYEDATQRFKLLCKCPCHFDMVSKGDI